MITSFTIIADEKYACLLVPWFREEKRRQKMNTTGE
jgi:hypothetical protein